VIEHLPSKPEALSSNPSATKKKRKKTSRCLTIVNFPLVLRAGRMAQAVEHLPSKHEALNSNPRITKIKKQKKAFQAPASAS
jgi:hypothetical protein